MEAEGLTQQPSRAHAHHCATQFASRNHSQAGISPGRERQPIGDQATPDHALSLQLRAGKIAPLLDALGARKTQ